MVIRRSWSYLWLAALGAGGCASSSSTDNPVGGDPSNTTGGTVACAADNGGIVLPPGFCATVFADELGRARHMAVTPGGDVFVTLTMAKDGTDPGKVIALRDADNDGVAEIRGEAVPFGGNGIAWQDSFLYLASNDRITRFAAPDGALVPESPLVLVTGLPHDGDHYAKSVVVDGDSMYVNIGSGSNACQVENRVVHSPGIDPCPELCVRAGVWKFSSSVGGQAASSGALFAKGVRNGNALALDEDGALWAVVNGRDQLHENWPELFTEAQDLRLPGEELVMLESGVDRGWPYCYYDPDANDMKLAPEYGGDGTLTGRCEAIENPETALPAHWAPLGAAFYYGDRFPEHYRGGMFIANHGSRFDTMNSTGNPGYNVVYVPIDVGGNAGDWEEFASGFTAGNLPLPDAAPHRPVSVAVMPDGALLISDDKGGRIWKVVYVGEGEGE